jgi:hypothetical protein
VQAANEVRRRAWHARRYLYRRRNAVLRGWHEERDQVHLVPDPVFVLCSVRSGSTLLRSILNTHTQVCAPHELHLGTMRVSTDRDYAVHSWEALGLSIEDLENVLWDRALHRLLVQNSARVVVDKTPQNAMIWPRIHSFWPRARYLHLRRHPAAIVDSLAAAQPDIARQQHVRTVNRYGTHLNAAREALPGLTVRYEDLTDDAERTVREICDYLGVRWQPQMLHYKRGGNRSGLGDWSAKIRSGQIQPHDPLPALEDVDPALRELVTAWGY